MNFEVLTNDFSLDPFERYAEAFMEADDDLPTSPPTEFFQALYDCISGYTGDDLVEDQTGEVLLPMDESDPLSSTSDVYSLIDFESKSPNQNTNLEDLPDDPTSQPLELGALPTDMSQTLESEVPGSHASSQSLELGAPPTHMSQTLESEVPGSHASSQPFELGAPPTDMFQTLESEVPGSHASSQSLEMQVFPDVYASPSFLNGSNQQHPLHAQQYQNVPTPPQFCGYYHQFIQSPAPSNKLLGPRISCHCKKTACLKGYCSCYKAKVGCSDVCQCEGCGNTYGCKNGGITSTFNSGAAQRDLPSNNISLVNEKPLGGGLDTLTHNSLNRYANQNTVYGAPTLNQFAPPPAVQMAQLPANLFAPPSAVQIVNVAHSQENPFAISSNISPPQADHKAANAQLQVNPFAPTYTAYQPQQQHMLMNSANSFVNDATYGVFRGNADSTTPLKQLPPRFRKEVNDIYWKHLPRE